MAGGKAKPMPRQKPKPRPKPKPKPKPKKTNVAIGGKLKPKKSIKRKSYS